ncbi:MAG: hypothetical protein K9K32_03635 [Halanaerobiales bacterium]|nr:hypothetical protein [Halanaerobiales bacterium]
MKTNKRKLKVLAVVTSLFLIIYLIIPFYKTEANVMVFPTRITFEDGRQSANLRLINTTDETVTYRVVFIQSKMNKKGKIEQIEVPNDKNDRLEAMMAQDLIRYSPRQVTLPPDVAQLVRIQLNIPVDLKEGEYRTRLLFQKVPKVTETKSIESEEPEGFSIQLQVVYGVSIPIIVRHGSTSAEVKLSDLKLITTEKSEEQDLIHEMSFIINRTGNQSVFGDIEINYINEKGVEKVIGRLSKVGVYTEINSRLFKVRLDDTDKIDFKNGKIEVIYRKPPEEGNEVLARKML